MDKFCVFSEAPTTFLKLYLDKLGLQRIEHQYETAAWVLVVASSQHGNQFQLCS